MKTISILGVVAGLLFVGGYGGMSYSQSARTPDDLLAPSASQPVGATPAVQSASKPQSTRRAAPKRAAQSRPSARRATSLGEPAFWQLMTETRRAADNDTGRQSELLEDRLRKLSPRQIIDFAQIRHRLDVGAYTWNLWAAAYVIEDGCSDDCFRDFRGYLISLGHSAYTKALRNPDSLASVVQDAETGSWENADNVAGDAYSGVTGGDFPLDDTDLSGRPRGTPFNENNSAALARRFPRLAARFR